MDARVPAHIEVSGLVRNVQAAGGFPAVIKKGERDAGTIMVVLTENGENVRAYERMPQLDGTRKWHCVKSQDTENKEKIYDYLTRRGGQDPDLWIVELDIADGERFIDPN
ncbi:DUF1491 family protein [Novosphingobium malaysiense]|uniref:DUF1491 family protein n=1 Tax=Novosphingobium malaysiense TaxID=1348853 RepID=A0A0B1ZF19_9SPHN|nr:DUF1491 family protein [Novosphingobium malaysiense]KHK89614.1 hypothetical protein LK12_21290 [Novosphingobium malaysiense]